MSPTAPTPTGRRETRDGVDHLVLTRTYRAPIETVWAALTEPGRLERWIGTWSGDPTTGRVDFRMTAEGEDAGVEVYEIERCDPPHRLTTRSTSGEAPYIWRLDLQLTEDAGVTTLTFAQELSDPDQAENIGPGWEYYLDRLTAVLTDTEVAAVDWDVYYPAMSDYYKSSFS